MTEARQEPRSRRHRVSRTLNTGLMLMLAVVSIGLPATVACAADIGDGLNAFSMFPFSGHTRFDWRTCSGIADCKSDCITPKGFTFARYQLEPGVEVDVYNAHLDSGTCLTDFTARGDQAKQLVREIVARSEGRAVIVAGDLNLRRSRLADGEILDYLLNAAGLRDTCDELNCGEDRLDRILVRSGDQVVLTPLNEEDLGDLFTTDFGDGPEPLSDHDPLRVNIQYEWYAP